MTTAIMARTSTVRSRARLQPVSALDPVQPLAVFVSAWILLHCGRMVFAASSLDRFHSIEHLIAATLALSVLAHIGVTGRASLRRLEVIAAAGVITGLTMATLAVGFMGHTHTMCCCAGC